MAVYSLQTSNTFSYSFPVPGNVHQNYLQIDNNAALNLNASNWTIEFWVKPVGNYNGYNALFAKRISNTSTTSYQGALNITSGLMSYYNGTIFPSTTRLSSNIWSHVAYVFNNGANLQIYVNGTRVLACTSVTSVTEVDTALSIGATRGPASIYPEDFRGQISNFRIIKGQAIYTDNFNISTFPVNLPNNAIGPATGNVAASLTGNVVLLTCKDQTIRAEGNVSHNIAVFGVVTPQIIDTNELQNFSYYYPGNTALTGQNGTVLVTSTTNSLNLNADFTIETWFYPQTNTGVLLERGLGGVTNNNASYILLWDTPNNNINFAVANANNVAYSVGALTGAAGSLGTPTLNAWNHIAVTRAGNTYRGFLNGALNFAPATNANTPYAALGRGLTIGGMFNNGQTYATGIPANTITGFISNLRIIRGNSVYNAAFTPSRTQSWNVTNTILLTGLTPAFEDLSGLHTLATNGASEIFFSTASPFTANAVINANATTTFTRNRELGQDEGRIYDKFDYRNFGQMVNIYAALGQDEGRIYNKFDFARFGQMTNIYAALAQDAGRIYDKFDSGSFASTPVNPASAVGQDAGRIYDKFDSGSFAAPPRSEAFTLGQDEGRIYNKFNYGTFGLMVNIYPAIGRTEGRIYSKQNMGGGFAYIPVGGAGGAGTGTANIEYEFWS